MIFHLSISGIVIVDQFLSFVLALQVSANNVFYFLLVSSFKRKTKE